MFRKFNRGKMLWCITLATLLFAFGCGGPAGAPSKLPSAADNNGLGPTIGTLAEIFASDFIPVRGYGLVGGLNGTGSSECPPQIRTYLEKYLLQHFSGTKVNIDEIISSPDTAVVIVEGIIPPAASQKQRFDIRVIALPGTQTTSLGGGWLYGADLYEARHLGISIKSLATTEGPVYVDLLDPNAADARTGYVLGGGSITDDYKINLALRRPDYRTASQIRNRINERFGYETAWALAPGSIELRVPDKYAGAKGKFIQLVRATYLAETPELVEKRIASHIQKLASSPNKGANEAALEAIGNACLPKLAALISSSDPEVRFRVARCMLNLGDNQGREALWSIAADKTSPYRVEAIEAIVSVGPKQDAETLLRGLLRDDDISVRLTACENLIRLNDVTVSQKLIADSFYLDQIPGAPGQPGKPAVFVWRQNQPRVVLLGSPIYCRGDIFIESPDGSITINAPAGQQFATIIRKHPRRSDTIIRLQSTLDLADIIQTLCSEPLARPSQGGPGLGIPYSTLVALLSQMADSGVFAAEFHASNLPGSRRVEAPRRSPDGSARTLPAQNSQPGLRRDEPKNLPTVKK